MADLSHTDFSRALGSGTGHARLQLERGGLGTFGEPLFRAIEFCHYADPQSWPDHEGWLLDHVEVCGRLGEWAPRIGALGPASLDRMPAGICADRTNQQRAGLGWELHRRGYPEGQRLLESLVGAVPDDPDLGMAELRKLGGETPAADQLEVVLRRPGRRAPERPGLQERLGTLEHSIAEILQDEQDLDASPPPASSAEAHDGDARDFRLWHGINRASLGEVRELKRTGQVSSPFFDRLEHAFVAEARTAAGRRLLLAGFRRHFRRSVAERCVILAPNADRKSAMAMAEVLAMCPMGEPVTGARSLGSRLLGDSAPTLAQFVLALSCLGPDASAADLPLVDAAARRLRFAAPPDPDAGSLGPDAALAWGQRARERGVDPSPLLALVWPALLSPHARSSAFSVLLRSGTVSPELWQLARRDVCRRTRRTARLCTHYSDR